MLNCKKSKLCVKNNKLFRVKINRFFNMEQKKVAKSMVAFHAFMSFQPRGFTKFNFHCDSNEM